eukprot:5535090-Amphidinium_carterae.5
MGFGPVLLLWKFTYQVLPEALSTNKAWLQFCHPHYAMFYVGPSHICLQDTDGLAVTWQWRKLQDWKEFML